MRVFKQLADIRGVKCGVLVPTMGALHEGHMTLVRRAKALDWGPVLVTIFVNRLQFGAGEDFTRYPRKLAEDRQLLAEAGADILLAPPETDIYPEAQTFYVDPPEELANTLEGAYRPGHFRGVATVVLKLLHVTQPDAAIFGKKDYQQLRVLQGMVRQLAVPVEVIEADTVRAEDGLAMSSRNAYLSQAERKEAPRLHRILRRVARAIRDGQRDFAALENAAVKELVKHHWMPDYVAVRCRSDLLLPHDNEQELVVLAAARLGTTRLIDNVEC